MESIKLPFSNIITVIMYMEMVINRKQLKCDADADDR